MNLRYRLYSYLDNMNLDFDSMQDLYNLTLTTLLKVVRVVHVCKVRYSMLLTVTSTRYFDVHRPRPFLFITLPLLPLFERGIAGSSPIVGACFPSPPYILSRIGGGLEDVLLLFPFLAFKPC